MSPFVYKSNYPLFIQSTTFYYFNNVRLQVQVQSLIRSIRHVIQDYAVIQYYAVINSYFTRVVNKRRIFFEFLSIFAC